MADLAEGSRLARALVTAADDPTEIVQLIDGLDYNELEIVVFALSLLASTLIARVAADVGNDSDDFRQRLFAQMTANAEAREE